MKRYRILSYDFDTRANILKQEIKNVSHEKAKAQWENNVNQTKQGLIAEYGTHNAFRKIQDFIDLGWLPISVIAFHNVFLRQVRDAYVFGSYYPSATGACALGERILNQLIIHLRDDFKASKEYKNVYRKDSFDSWDTAISTLESWHILLPEVVLKFKELKEIRNRVIHFNPETDRNDKKLALSAIHKLTKIVEMQFSGFGTQPWFIEGIPGSAYIKKEYEGRPFVKHIIIPNCALVGPYHHLQAGPKGWIVLDDHNYESKEISDSEFAELLKHRGA